MPAYHIQGQVLNEYGQPAVAELFLLDHIRGDLLHESPLGRTDSQGFFDIQSAGRFFHRSPRSLQLLAVGSGANRGSGSTRNVTGTGFVEIAKRMSADLEPGVLPAPIKNIEITLHQMHLRAQVVDDSGTPLAGVLVEAKAQSDSWSTSMPLLSVPVGRKLWLDALPDSFEQVFRRTTDAWGWVEFDRLPLLDDLGKPAINGYRLNTWILHATLDGFAPETVHSVSTISPDAGPVVTAFKMFQPPTIVLQRPAPIVITGLVLDPTGAPVIGATIEMPWSELATVTDNSGAWSWTLQSADLLPLDLTCSVDGYSTRHWTLTPELIDYDLQARHNFQLEASIGLSIQVVDLGGQPVDGVMVSVSRTTPRQPEPLIPGTTTTQLGGWTRWTHLPAGQWTIRIGNSRFHNGGEIEPIETTVVIGSEPLERSFQVTLSGKSEADGNPSR